MYPAGGRKVFYLRKEQFIMLSNIAHFVAWILSLTGLACTGFYCDFKNEVKNAVHNKLLLPEIKNFSSSGRIHVWK